jgi:hypothetical protein
MSGTKAPFIIKLGAIWIRLGSFTPWPVFTSKKKMSLSKQRKADLVGPKAEGYTVKKRIISAPAENLNTDSA